MSQKRRRYVICGLKNPNKFCLLLKGGDNMRLFTCLDIANACCLETVGDAILNIELHAISTFNYGKIEEEISELYQEVKSRRINSKMNITEALGVINEQDNSDLRFCEYVE